MTIPEKYYKNGKQGINLPFVLLKKAKLVSATTNLSLEYIVTDALYEYLLKNGEIKNDEREKDGQWGRGIPIKGGLYKFTCLLKNNI